MATITLTADTAYSAIAATLADDDTIDLAGWELDVDTVPTETGITVQTPGTAGTVVFSVSGECDLATWDFCAGTTNLVTTLPSTLTIGLAKGGETSTARGVLTNNGRIGLSQGGDSSGSEGCNTNNGVITRSLGGGASGANGCQTNSNFVGTAEGGAAGAGIASNDAIVLLAIGGDHANASGVVNNYGECRATTDSTGRAVSQWYGDYHLVDGPTFTGEVVVASSATWTTLYSIGALSESATLPEGVTVVELSEGGSSGGGIYNPMHLSNRPDTLVSGDAITWPIFVTDQSNQLADADDTPSILIRRDGADTAESVTVTKRAATTGIYDCSYTPASPTINEVIEVVETADISETEYVNPWSFRVIAQNQDALILSKLSGGAITSISNVYAGGRFTLIQGDSHTVAEDNAIELQIDDTGGTLAAELKHADVEEIICGLRREDGLPSEITGTVDPDNISASNDITTVVIEFAADAVATDATHTEWKYHIQKKINSGKPVTRIKGTAKLELDNAA